VIYVLLSYLAAPLIAVLLALRRGRAPGRILLIQTAKIGDMLCATPLLREIKRAYPGASLSVLLDPVTRPILEYNPNVDEIIPIRNPEIKGLRGKLRLTALLRRGRYDVAIVMNPNLAFAVCPFWAAIPVRLAVYPDFAGTAFRLASPLFTRTVPHRPDRLLIDAWFDLLATIGVEGRDGDREIFGSPAGAPKARRLLAGHPGPYIGIGVSSGNKLKALGPDKIAALADLLRERTGCAIVLIGAEADGGEAGRIAARSRHPEGIIDATGKFGLSELPALLEELSLYIGVDSGITYMADAVSVPIVLIAGPVNPAEQRPTRSPCIIIQRRLPCAPCAHVFKAPYSCAVGTRECIVSVTPEEVADAAMALWENGAESRPHALGTSE
jgi:ADP-heptose:LPS heptosyltransferase